jgi:AraC-like DNA-binding protein
MADSEQIRNRQVPKTSSVAHGGGLRSAWLSETVRDCQALLSQSLRVGPNALPAAAGAFVERLAPPRTPVERLVQRGLLLEVALQFGHAVHANYHRLYSEDRPAAGACGFVPAATMDGWPRDLPASPAEAFRRWSRRYAEAFRDAHSMSCAREAEAFIKEHYREPIAASALAEQLSCPGTFLRRTFKQLTGRSLLEYQSELRLRAALRLLSESDLKMEAIAYDVGYRSKKDLYRVVQAHLKCTPLEYRQQMRGTAADRRGNES